MDKMIQNNTNLDKNVQKIRLNNVSLIRFISFACIFFHHTLIFWTPFGRQYFPLCFAVQVFLFISGFLYSKKEITNIKSFYLKNGLKILIPAGILVIFYFVLYLIINLCGGQLRLYDSIPHGSVSTGFDHYWFICAICVCYLITPLLYKLSEAFQQNNTSKTRVLLLLVLILIVIDAIASQIGSQSLITSYCLGYLFRYIYDGKFFQKHKDIIAFIAFLIFVGASLLYYTLVNWEGVGLISFYTYPTFCKELLMIVFAISFTIFMLVTFEFLNQKDYKFNKFLRVTDKYAYCIYLTHQTVLCGSFATIHYISNPYLATVIALALTLTLSIALEFISTKTIKFCSKNLKLTSPPKIIKK